MERPIYLHIGKPKCASTFMQKELFPYSTHKYLGKSHDFDVIKNYTMDPGGENPYSYYIVKAVISKGLKNLKENLIINCRSILPNKGLLLSEELITCRFIYRKHYKILREFVTKPSYIKPELLLEEAYSYGLNWEENSLELEVFDVANVISNIANLFDRNPAGILVVDRNYADWIISLFLEFQSLNVKDDQRSFNSDCRLFSETALIGLAGVTLGLEELAFKKGYSYGISTANTIRRIKDNYPKAKISVLRHSDSKQKFRTELSKIPSCFGLVEAIRKISPKTNKLNSSLEKVKPSFNIEETKKIINNFIKERSKD